MRFSRKERKGRKERIDKMKKQTKTILALSLARGEREKPKGEAR